MSIADRTTQMKRRIGARRVVIFDQQQCTRYGCCMRGNAWNRGDNVSSPGGRRNARDKGGLDSLREILHWPIRRLPAPAIMEGLWKKGWKPADSLPPISHLPPASNRHGARWRCFGPGRNTTANILLAGCKVATRARLNVRECISRSDSGRWEIWKESSQ